MFQKIVVPLIGNASLRLSLGSGSIRATAEDRDDVLIDGKSPHFAGAEIDDTVVVDVAVAGGGGSVELTVPVGTDLTLGTQSGRVTLKGAFGVVRITTESGSIDVDRCDRGRPAYEERLDHGWSLRWRSASPESFGQGKRGPN